MSEETKVKVEKKLSGADLVNQLRKGKKLHDEFAKQFKEQYKIAGQLIEEWKKHFKISIPPDFNPQVCQLLDAKLMELHQEAAFLKAESEARLAAYKSTNSEYYRTEYAELVTEYRQKGQKLPAKDTLSALAEHATGDIKDALVHAEIELLFWKEILNDLNNSRKLVKDATINLTSEAKALANERYIDSLTSRKDYGGRNE